MFWSIIGGPYEGKYRFASIVHDRYCVDHGGRTWKEVHRMFHHACLAGGTDPQLAKLMYAAVYHFGPRWSDEDKGVDELAALIPPERARSPRRWKRSSPPRAAPRPRGPARRRRRMSSSIATWSSRRAREPPPRAATEAEGTTLDKWDRIREFIRTRPGATLDQVEQVE